MARNIAAPCPLVLLLLLMTAPVFRVSAASRSLKTQIGSRSTQHKGEHQPTAPKAWLLGSAQTTALPTAQDYLPGFEPHNLPPWVYAHQGNSYQNSCEHYYSREQYDGRERPYGGEEHPYNEHHDRYDSEQEEAVFNFVAKDGTSVLESGATSNPVSPGDTANRPVVLYYR